MISVKMCLLVGLSIVIIVWFKCISCVEFDQLNICEPQTAITVRHAFRFQNKFVAFVTLNTSSENYVIKVNGFDPIVSDNNEFDSKSQSVELWNDWNLRATDNHHFNELDNFDDVFVREDPMVEYVVYLDSGYYFRTKYDSAFKRIEVFHGVVIANSGDELQIAIKKLFGDKYLTAMRFPTDNSLPKLAFVYKTANQTTDNIQNYNVVVMRNIISGNRDQWIPDDETIDLSDDSKIVSSFYMINYTSVEENKKQFYMMEILSNGVFKVKQIILSDTDTDLVTISTLDSDVYNGHIRQLFQCLLLPTLSSATTTVDTNLSSDSVSHTESTTLSTPESSSSTFESSITTTAVVNLSPNTTAKILPPVISTTDSGEQSKNSKWLYIVVAIILLLIIAAIIVLVWCCCCRKNKKSESLENEAKPDEESNSIPKDENIDIPSEGDERIIFSNTDEETQSIRSESDSIGARDTGNQSQTETPENPSGVSPQTQTPNATLKKKSLNKDYDETALYSIDGVKRYK